MALRFASLLLISFAALGLGNAIPAFPSQKCGANAEFQTCGSACEPTCADRNPGPACTLQCVIGCFCKEGFLKNSKGECVRLSQCDVEPISQTLQQTTCGANEEYKQCKGCDDTCFERNRPCPRICLPGCACKKGFVRNENDRCVALLDCPIIDPPVKVDIPAAVEPVDGKCAANEVFNPCGSACAPTCANQHPSPVCTKNCVIGCYCKEGFLRNYLGVCVPTKECGPEAPVEIAMPEMKCPAKEVFNPCGSACAPTCANPNPSPICTKQCVIGCFCQQGHLRNNEGTCVPANECKNEQPVEIAMGEMKCPANEVFNPCGSACAPDCANPNPSPKCTKQCVIGCFCKDGHLRNSEGTCVPSNECVKSPVNAASFMQLLPPPICGENEEARACKGCDASCNNRNPICPFSLRICRPGCACKNGYVRDDNTGRCIPEIQCPQNQQAAQVFAAIPEQKCGANAVFQTCGSACAPTCANPKPGPICTLQCVIGCFCKEGFLKNAKGECVPADECEKPVPVPLAKSEPIDKCNGQNEMFHECGVQLDCLHRCTEKHTPICMQRMCTPGCVCKQPFVRNENGQCVEPKECPNKPLLGADGHDLFPH